MSDRTIVIAATAHEIQRCLPLLQILRPQLAAATFVAQVQRLQQQGYELAYLTAASEIRTVAGFHCLDSLAFGRFMRVDVLVTRAGDRSQGYGQQLLTWLCAQAQQRGCQQVHLDSGLHRTAAHRFYQRHDFHITSHHFARSVLPEA